MKAAATDEMKVGIDPERWLAKYGDYLYGYALSRLREPETAEELMQEALLAALESRNRFAGQCSEKTWLISILKHKIIDHFRRMNRAKNFSSIDGINSEGEDFFHREGRYQGHWRVADGLAPSEWGEDPQSGLEKREFWRALERSLATLQPRLAQAFYLREIDALSTEEVCDALNVSANNLWVMLHRARLQLRRSLEVNWLERRNES